MSPNKTRKIPKDPYISVIDAFNKANVQYVVVGVAGINYYVSETSDLIMTGDYDILIKPTKTNVLKATRILMKEGFELAVGSDKFRFRNINWIISNRKTIVAKNFYGCLIEILLDISGYTYENIADDACVFNAGKISIRVGQLKKLLNSKRIADRPKDRIFLERYIETKLSKN